ncbi:Hypothetical protein MAB_4888 [Mycobacteroides abscessus ATCC 19977]|uniref:Uncharacterized protein n=2 Tax=Mycobacteroides abscessus TaxID=36809 RepID=B1MMH1_MYCA9|nr:Hypothetical protein MAB_4888 [Mycobacteroides abscessus ATCC 19977]
MPTRNQRLRTLTGSHIWPQHDRPSFIVRSWPRLVDHHFKWPSGMPEPQFIRTHHMPTRLVTRREQEIDGSTAWTLMPTARNLEDHVAAPGLPIPAALRMWGQPKDSCSIRNLFIYHRSLHNPGHKRPSALSQRLSLPQASSRHISNLSFGRW